MDLVVEDDENWQQQKNKNPCDDILELGVPFWTLPFFEQKKEKRVKKTVSLFYTNLLSDFVFFLLIFIFRKNDDSFWKSFRFLIELTRISCVCESWEDLFILRLNFWFSFSFSKKMMNFHTSRLGLILFCMIIIPFTCPTSYLKTLSCLWFSSTRNVMT